METLFYLLIIVFIGILVWIALVWSTMNRKETPDLLCVGSASEPVARFWMNRLKDAGIWSDIRHVGGVTTLSIELGSGMDYQVWVRSQDYNYARSTLGLGGGDY